MTKKRLMQYIYTGWGKKTGLFLRVDNFATVMGRNTHTQTHTHTRLTALFRDYPGEPVPER